MNKCVIMGRMTKDAELRYTQAGTACCYFSVAVDRKFLKDGKREADFFNCVAWGKTAEFISQYFHKGNKIAIDGRLQTRSYEAQDGSKRNVTEVVAEQVEFVESKPKNENTDSYEVSFDDDELPFN